MLHDLPQRSLRRLSRLTSGSVNRRIFSAALIVGVLTAGVSLVSMLKELLVAASFGTSDAIDAFLIAFLLPTFVINVVAGSFSSSIIPIYLQVRERECRDAAQQLFSSVVLLGVALLATVVVVLALSGPFLLPLLGSGFGPEKLMLTQQIFYLLLPAVIINGLAIIWSAILNAEERFAWAAVAPALVPFSMIAFLVVAGDQWGIYALAVGIVVGFMFQLCLLGWALRRQDITLRPGWYGMTTSTRQAIRQYAPVTAGAVFMSSTLLVDQAVAATLPAGSVAALGYGNKIVALVLSLGAMAIGTAVLPYFSRMVAQQDWLGVRHTLRTYLLRLILPVTVPSALLLFFFSEPLTRLLFQRGAFTVEDTGIVAGVQSFYTLQIPFYIAGILGVRLISALGKNHVLMIISGFNLLTNIVADLVLTRLMGVTGIALATSIVHVASTGMIFLFLASQLKNLSNTQS